MAEYGSPPNPPRRPPLVALLSVAAVLVVAALVLTVVLPRIKNGPTTSTAHSTPASHVLQAEFPKYYTDIIGKISAVGTGTVTVDLTTGTANGQATVKKYQVTVNSTTSFFSSAAAKNVPAITAADLRVGDRVQAISDGKLNLADHPSFTATRIIRLSTSSTTP